MVCRRSSTKNRALISWATPSTRAHALRSDSGNDSLGSLACETIARISATRRIQLLEHSKPRGKSDRRMTTSTKQQFLPWSCLGAIIFRKPLVLRGWFCSSVDTNLIDKADVKYLPAGLIFRRTAGRNEIEASEVATAFAQRQRPLTTRQWRGQVIRWLFRLIEKHKAPLRVALIG